MSEVEIHETGPGREFELTHQQAAALERSGLVRLQPRGDRSWIVSGTGRVGTALVADVVLRILPKVPVGHIFWLLGFGRRPAWSDDLVPYDATADLVHTIAESFARLSDRALGRGVVHGYQSYDDELATIRGRLRSTEQVTKRFGQITPLLVRYDDFTADIPENQLIKAAAKTLRSVPGLGAPIARRLRAITDRLADVTDISTAQLMPVWTLDRRNAHYERALRFAEMILRNQSVDLSDGDVEINGLMVNMALVFENFVATAFADVLPARAGGYVAEQDSQTLDEAGRIMMNPDLVWYRDGAPTAVIDAKYKVENPAGYPNADMYQLLAYCTALGLREGHLVYARGAEVPQTHVVRHAGIRIITHAIDLSQEPGLILARVETIATTLISAS